MSKLTPASAPTSPQDSARKEHPAPKRRPYYGLSARCTKKTSRELIDYDYLNKLSPEELDWLDRFSREWAQNTFPRTGAMHATPEQRRPIYAMDNARRRDMWNHYQRLPNDYIGTTIAEEDND